MTVTVQKKRAHSCHVMTLTDIMARLIITISIPEREVREEDLCGGEGGEKEKRTNKRRDGYKNLTCHYAVMCV